MTSSGRTSRARGTLLCDIDELRSWVSGWEDDFVGTGEAVRRPVVDTTDRDAALAELALLVL